jgi:hypothetical protein
MPPTATGDDIDATRVWSMGDAVLALEPVLRIDGTFFGFSTGLYSWYRNLLIFPLEPSRGRSAV